MASNNGYNTNANNNSAVASSLHVELAGSWEELWCEFEEPLQQLNCFDKNNQMGTCSKDNKGELVLELKINNGDTAKAAVIPLATLSKLLRTAKLPESPYFFNIIVSGHQYKFACGREDERSKWVRAVKMASGELNPQGFGSSFPRPLAIPDASMLATYDTYTKGASSTDVHGENSQKINPRMKSTTTRAMAATSNPKEGKRELPADNSTSAAKAVLELSGVTSTQDGGDDNEPDDDTPKLSPFYTTVTLPLFGTMVIPKFCYRLLKQETLSRLFKVVTAFPFVIIVASMNLTGPFASILKSVAVIRVMNFLIYVLPIILVKYVLSAYVHVAVQDVTIGLYLLLYLAPVAFVVSRKVGVSSATNKIEEGTFCFKPARTVRCTQSNFYAMVGFFFEWLQHTVYVLPVGVVSSASKRTLLKDYPPFLSFKVYFWMSVASTFLCGIIIVLNAVLKGKIHYKFQKSGLIWYILFNIGSPMYVTIVTILFMGLSCDYSTNPPVLVQDPSLVCYSDQHIVMARAALMALAIYVIQHTLLPSGTFKETMGDNDLEIMFVPVYLQAHFLLKAIFCGIYVLFYSDNYIRVVFLTAVNILLLCLNNFMKPCSVEWINLLRDTFFVHATLSGIQSINYLLWPINISTKSLVISTLGSNVVFVSIAMYVYYKYTFRSTEFTIARAFLELEWQVSRGGSVHPRVLEPLISLTLSQNPEDWEIAKKYIGQLVWLISYPNIRVQFQSAWGLANLAMLEEDARKKIHEAGGTKMLFEWYTDMDFVVQLEALAAMANLTLSEEVSDEMVTRFQCIPFFMSLVASNKLKHSQFAAIALGNIARKEFSRDLLRKAGGLHTLVGCVMSHDYQKRRYGCMALANLALSPAPEIVHIFESRGLMDRIIKMAARKEIETQREVVALIRNLCCHGKLRPLLLDRGCVEAIQLCTSSVYEDVCDLSEEILLVLGKQEAFGGSLDLKSLQKREESKRLFSTDTDLDALKKMEPLSSQVEWSTWGSKLESIFSPVFSTMPTTNGSSLTTVVGQPVSVHLAAGIPPAMMERWKEAMTFYVVERPLHGKLNKYVTSEESVIYTPHDGYIGSDFFTFRLRINSTTQSPSTVALVIVPASSAVPDAVVSDIEKGIMSPNSRTINMKRAATSRNVGATDLFEQIQTVGPSSPAQTIRKGDAKREGTNQSTPNSRNGPSSSMELTSPTKERTATQQSRRPSLIDAMLDSARTVPLNGKPVSKDNAGSKARPSSRSNVIDSSGPGNGNADKKSDAIPSRPGVSAMNSKAGYHII